jgi:predicted metal-dependent hydrolase
MGEEYLSKAFAAVSGNFSYAVTFQKRKTLVVYVHDDGNVEVRAPHGLSQKHIVRFVEEKSAWIKRSLAKQSHKHQWKNSIEPGASMWFLGQPRRLEVERSDNASILYDEEVIVVAARDPWNLPALSRQLNTWYREQAETIFRERMLLVCQRFPGIPAAPELRLRKMERRWGSCSRSGRVTLNTELVKLPMSMIDYIIAHELCHLTEFNHSKKFYALLEYVMPDWKQRERILKQF